MKIFEIFAFPQTAVQTGEMATELLLEFRRMAAEHGITIDGQYGMGGNSRFYNKLPILRKSLLLYGGQFMPKGGHQQEAKREKDFETRVGEFLKDLHKKLMQIQVQGLNGDLEFAHHVTIGHENVRAGDELTPIDKMTAEQWFKSLPWKERKLRGISCTWAIARAT